MIDALKGILKLIQDALLWLVSLVEWVIVHFFKVVLEAVVYVLSAIPVPAWLTNLPLNMSGIDAGVMVLIQPLQVQTGITWIVSAYVLRFLIRRIPVIG